MRLLALNKTSVRDELEAGHIPDHLDTAAARGDSRLRDRVSGTYAPVTQRLREAGADDTAIDYITRRKRREGRVARRGFLAAIFSR